MDDNLSFVNDAMQLMCYTRNKDDIDNGHIILLNGINNLIAKNKAEAEARVRAEVVNQIKKLFSIKNN